MDFTIPECELGLCSPLRVNCEDREVSLSDFYYGDELCTAIDLLDKVLNKGGIILDEKEIHLLSMINNKLDIPKIYMFTEVDEYSKLYKLVKYKYTRIPESLNTESNMKTALTKGHIDVIRYFREKPIIGHGVNMNLCQCDLIVCQFAAQNGHLHVLKWIEKNRTYEGKIGNLPWDEWTYLHAAEGGHLHIMEHIHSIHQHHFNEFHRKAPLIYEMAAMGGHIHVLEWTRNKNIHGDILLPWTERYMICENAAQNGHLDTLKYMRNKNIHGLLPDGTPDIPPLSELTCIAAARNGHTHVLEWLRDPNEHGLLPDGTPDICPWDERTCEFAAMYGHLNTLKWLRNKDIHGLLPDGTPNVCPWNEKTCKSIIGMYNYVMYGSRNNKKHSWNHEDLLNVLKWVRDKEEHGKDVCPWDEETRLWAEKHGIY